MPTSNAGIDIYDIMKVTGHASPEILKKYIKADSLDVAEKLCNKVAIIKAGKIIANGTMEELVGDKSLEEVFLEEIDEK